MKEPTTFESFSIDGDQLLQRVKELIHEGNVRHIRIKQDGHTILELPLTVGDRKSTRLNSSHQI